MCGIIQENERGERQQKIKGRLQRQFHGNFSAMLVAHQPTMKVKYCICSHSLVTQWNQNSYYPYIAYCNLLHRQFISLTQAHGTVLWINSVQFWACANNHVMLSAEHVYVQTFWANPYARIPILWENTKYNSDIPVSVCRILRQLIFTESSLFSMT